MSRPCSTSATGSQAACWLAEGGKELPMLPDASRRWPRRPRPLRLAGAVTTDVVAGGSTAIDAAP